MSAIARNGLKCELPRRGMEAMWKALMHDFAERHPEPWLCLAMYTLRFADHWSIKRIAAAFARDPGFVTRMIEFTREELLRLYGYGKRLHPHRKRRRSQANRRNPPWTTADSPPSPPNQKPDSTTTST